MDRTFLQLVKQFDPSNGTEFCQQYLNGSETLTSDLTKDTPSPYKVWGIGLLMVSAICLSSASGIVLLPLLSPAAYRRTLTFFVAVGVGTLSGSAFFNLLPEAFELAVYMPDYLLKAWTAVAGIYLFYIVDKLLNISIAWQQQKSTISPAQLEMKSAPHEHQRRISVESGHSHTATDTIAWLVIFGDGLHNFIDGLSIGAAFGESILNGISVGVAVLCEEVPHELGDCAILLNSGMSLWRALFFNLLSSSTCFVGFIIGVMAGNVNRHFGRSIFALAGGMFLYVSLVGMLSEMNRKVKKELQKDTTRAAKTIALQMIGLTVGLVIMYLFARYGYLIQFQ